MSQVPLSIYFTKVSIPKRGDLVHLEGKTVDELKTFCSNDPSCLGFNTKGWVKTSLLPKFKWNYWTSDPSKGFYLKRRLQKFPSGTNSSHSSYMFFQGLDSDGGDLIEKIKF